MENKKIKAGITCCSNGQKKSYSEKLKYLSDTLSDIGIIPVFSNIIYEKEDVFSGTACERAEALMDFYRDIEIKEIFDISGGDIANGILPYLDYELIKNSTKRLWGYSDLTTVINAIYAKTGKPSVLYQVRNLIYDCREQQVADFQNTVVKQQMDLFKLDCHFIQQENMHGIVVGGNIRCFLKLAGTEYMPDLENKILLLESRNSRPAQIETYLCQLAQSGAFNKAAGILLGTFTQMEKENCFPDVIMLLKKFIREDLPVAVTKNIGHGTDSKGIIIGNEMFFDKYNNF